MTPGLYDPYGQPVTPRQIDVLRSAAKGTRGAQTALDLGIALKTVKTAKYQAGLRLGALNTTHAVAIMDDNAPGWRPFLPMAERVP